MVYSDVGGDSDDQIWLNLSYKLIKPGEEGVDPDVGCDNDEEGEEEDLAVVGRVVDVRPVVGAENRIEKIKLNSLFILFDLI